MRRTFTATLTREGDWCVAQIDIVSQGESEPEALANLAEALELAFSEPYPVQMPELHIIDVEIHAPWTASLIERSSGASKPLGSAS